MSGADSWRVCHACGREVEMAQGQSLGEALSGWFILSRIKGDDSFERLSFCSLGCLGTWAQSHLPAIPDVFRRSLDDEVVS